MKYIVRVGYSKFEFLDSTEAMTFAETAKYTQKDKTDEVTIELVDIRSNNDDDTRDYC